MVNGAFHTVTKGLLKGLEDTEVGGRVETIQITALLRTARRLGVTQNPVLKNLNNIYMISWIASFGRIFLSYIHSIVF